jgi:hypothetical protein
MVNIDNEESGKELLDETDDSQSEKRITFKTNWTIEVIKKKRKIYLVWFLCNFLLPIVCYFLLISNSDISQENFESYIALMSVGLILSHLIFCIYFYNITKNVVEDYYKSLVIFAAISGLCMSPEVQACFYIVSLLIFATVDNRIRQTIQLRESGITPKGFFLKKTSLSPLSVFSLVLFFIPAVGIILGIVSLRKISVKDSNLHGKPFAWIGIILNSLCTMPYIWLLLMFLYEVATN